MNELLLRLRRWLWDTQSMAPYPKQLIALARYLFVLLRDMFEGQISMRAMSLVYTTLLSIVPLLALAFSVLKALGAHNALEPVLLEFLRPLGPQAETLTDNVIGFVENIRVGVLGSVGVFLLFWTAISLIQKVESAFNFIWRIDRPRSLSQRLGEYFAVLTLGPVAVFSAMGLTATILNSSLMTKMASIEPFGMLIYMGTRLIPYVLIIGVFTFMYGFLPNTRVRWRAAVVGGLFAGLLWQASSMAFASFAASATNYSAIYSSFAILILLLIWLHVGWLILLLGCQLAFYLQHPEYLKPQKVPPSLSAREIEYLGLAVMAMVGRRFMLGQAPYTPDELSLALNAEPDHVDRVIDILLFQKALAETGDDRTRLIPGVDLDSIELARLWRMIRVGVGGSLVAPISDATEANKLIEQGEKAFESQTGQISLRQWLIQEKPSTSS